MLIDTHAHLDFKQFDQDRDEVIKRAFEQGVEKIINVGTTFEGSKASIALAEKYENIFATVSLHPIDVDKEEFDEKIYQELAQHPKVVAIGEIGLDYYYKPKTKRKFELLREKQKEIFLKQLNLARALNLPIILHCRMAHNDLIETITQFQNSNKFTMVKKLPFLGVVHCFTGTWEQARKYLEIGFYLGFNGIIFKLNLDEIIKNTPLDKILIETDCPFLMPPQVKGERNEPSYLKYIAQKIAEIKSTTFQEVARTTTQNVKDLFDI